MFNFTEFLINVKRAALEAVHAEKPFALLRGVVTNDAPLRIRIEQKLEIPEAQLILTNAVRDYKVTLIDETGETKAYKVQQALRKDEKVILLRTDGGQRFIVLDRAEVLNDT